MSYTNQDQYRDNSATTGTTGKTSGQFGSTNPFDNSRTAKGGNDFGVSRDPNNFSTAGNTDSLTNDFGRGTQTSDFSNTDRASSNTNDAATTGFSSGGATVGGTDMYGAQSGSTGFDDRKMDARGDTMVRDGEGFGAGTGTAFGSTGRDTTSRSDDVYGNYTGSDAGRAGVPPPGFRGGANDPAYQPGQRYDHKAGGLVRDDDAEVGTRGDFTTGQTMPGHRGHHATQPISTDDTMATSMGLGTGMGATDNWEKKDDTDFGRKRGTTDTDVATGQIMPGHHGHHATQPISTDDTMATSMGLGTGTGTTDNWEKKDDTDRDFGRKRGTVDTGFGTKDTPSTATGFDNSGTSGFKNDASEFSTGTSNLGTTTGNTTTRTNRGSDALQQVNTVGGGEGWKSGMTGLTEEEVKQVQGGRHAPSAVDAHPNPNAMDSYDV